MGRVRNGVLALGMRWLVRVRLASLSILVSG